MAKWKNLLKDALTAYISYAAFGGFFTNSQTVAQVTARKTRKVAKSIYDNYTGHYGRQQERLSEGQQKADIIEQEERKQYALAQRKVMIDEQRERMGVGGKKFNTSTRFEPKGKAAKRETLG